MLPSVIHILELVVCALLVVWCVRLFRLSRSETLTYQHRDVKSKQDSIKKVVGQAIADKGKKVDSTINYENNMQSLKLAQSFTSAQLATLKGFSVDDENWVNEVSSLYIIGAVEYIGNKTRCSVKCRKELVRLVLKSNHLVTKKCALSYFSEITHRAFSEQNEHLIRSGAKAAKIWLKRGVVPEDVSLRHQIAHWWRGRAEVPERVITPAVQFEMLWA